MSPLLSLLHPRRAAALALVAVAASFGACGDDDKTPATTPAESTPSEMAAQARADPKVEAAVKEATSGLKKAGIKVPAAQDKTTATGAIRLKGATIFFLRTPEDAANVEKQLTKTYKAADRLFLIEADGAHVVLVKPRGKKTTAADKARFKELLAATSSN